MGSEGLRSVLENTGLDLWALIETAISVAARDHGEELRSRRDGIVERLYGSVTVRGFGEDRIMGGVENKQSDGDDFGSSSPATPQSVHREQEEEEEEHRVVAVDDVDDEQSNIVAIKKLIEDPNQEEVSLVNLLQNLADMEITFKALQETDIGRHVNGLRKHSSMEVRRLVKVLVRKWKDLVDEWVKLNSHETAPSAIISDDSPQQNPAKTTHNGNHHVPEFGYSPNPHNGSSGSDRNNWEAEPKAKVVTPVTQKEPTATKQNFPNPIPPSVPHKQQQPPKDDLLDPGRLASARRRLQENYQEAQNAKKQRTIQVMDIHDIPKPKNAFFPRNKQVKHR